jgi:cytochrome c-type biogenesis protein
MFNLSTYLDGSHVNLAVAFLAGFITFFASCLLPLVPTYLAYLSGVSLADSDASQKRWSIVRVATMFVAGFILAFLVLGLLSHQLAGVVASYRLAIEKIAGVFFIILGLGMLGAFKHRWFTQERKLNVQGLFQTQRYLHAFLVGIAFGFGWTPCIGPVLAVILYWSSQQQMAAQGTGLLVMYGLGLGVPFILVAAGFETLIPLLKKYRNISRYINYLSAALIILAGILLFVGQFQRLSLVLLQFFNLNTLAS